VPALTGHRVLYRDGVPIAMHLGGEVRFLETMDAQTQWSSRATLLRRQVPVTLQFLA
jgi:ATP-dependent helicase Lhr and Lhr-like helicase